MLFRFVAGNNINQVLSKSKLFIDKKTIPIINYISENNNNNNNNMNEYKKLAYSINSNYIVALKLSSLNFNESSIFKTCDLFEKKNIKLIIDAENDENIEKYRKITDKLLVNYNRKKLNIIKTYQMYRKDSLLELCNDLKMSEFNNNKFSAKLVRGAYWHEDKNSKNLYIDKYKTDNNYNLGIFKCFESKYNNHIIATHNSQSIKIASKLDHDNNKFIIANLLGMNEDNMKIINHKKAIYIPYGPYIEMIPYLIRRLYENYDQLKYLNLKIFKC